MSDGDDLEVTREGLLGLIAGKAKEAAGTLVGNEHLVEEGRQQQAEIDQDAEAARDDEAAARDREVAPTEAPPPD